ncbi:hypothetical protein BCU68_03790 [Vibrio sp. 10N.286.49.B3]|uniref:FUSC family protein n=1 Tax=Vibrio sp. 10N.286.49.B3 TaxID=1880855 RepID=UPI000C82F4BC|nr:FUSC family protein [Vibrio sp. 10N.286.49.B3]PMH43120.1 hypothetical protein BCU68_03790 [Vibrio sp. 10N.286.49.B3]
MLSHLSHNTKEAIKVGIAVAISILLPLSLGWDKPYWAAITVFIVAANETYSHAIRKGQNRLLGTLLGACYATFLLAFFAQERLLFITFYVLFLALCVAMSSHKRFGYAFTIGFVVCTIISTVGGFDSATTFNIAILRMKENVLGIIAFSLVFRFIWPVKTESTFFTLLKESIYHIKLCLVNNGTNISKNNDEQIRRLTKLQEILALPLNGSSRLLNEKNRWKIIIDAMIKLETLSGVPSDIARHKKQGIHLIICSLSSLKSNQDKLKKWIDKTETDYLTTPLPQSSFAIPASERLRKVITAVSILVTCLLMWIYIPVPGGYIMPMISAIFANVLVTLPNNAIKHAGIGSIVWGVFFLAQYIFIMPTLTEAWQLAGLFFANGFFIWKVCASPKMAIQKVLGGNLSVVLTMSALQSTPSYSIETPLLMLSLVFVCLGVASFYTKLYNPNLSI